MNLPFSSSASESSPAPRTLWPLILGVSVCLALGIGVHFWWQLRSFSRPPAVATAKPAVPAPEKSLPAQAEAAESAEIAPTPAASVGGLPSSAEAAAMTLADQMRSALPPSARMFPVVQHSIDAVTTLPQQMLQAHAAADGTMTPFTKTPSAATLPLLEKAWNALQAGELSEANADYAKVLLQDPRQVDALLGMASVALQRGENNEANEHYLRAIETDPDDATAQAGLVNLKGLGNIALSESQLKTALSRQPESAPLQFSLGNVYAQDGRWSDAQQAWFKAFSSDPGNPDYLFNLAVSLDHLHQPHLAAQYYRQALDAADKRRSVFDRGQAEKRLTELLP